MPRPSPQPRPPGAHVKALCLTAALFAAAGAAAAAKEPRLGSERVVVSLGDYGEVELGFYPELAPVTAAHILKLFRMGCYKTNHVFRVDKGFVAQVADVIGGRREPLDAEQHAEAERHVPGEFQRRVLHQRGVLSMGRFDDPDSGQSSFSILLGDAPHLDGQYTVFGRLTKGDDVLSRLEAVETRQEGIFVMPLKRIEINDTRVVDAQTPRVRGSAARGHAEVAGPGFSLDEEAASTLANASGARLAHASGAVVAAGFADADASSPVVVGGAVFSAAVITLAVLRTRRAPAPKERD